jgi:DNA repair protein RadA/Sms
VDIRLAEVKKMGFNRCLVPDSNLKRIHEIDGIEVSGIKKVSDAVDTLF